MINRITVDNRDEPLFKGIDNETYFFLSKDGLEEDETIDTIALLLEDFVDDVDYDDLCGSSFVMDITNLDKPSINQLVAIGRSFGYNAFVHPKGGNLTKL